VGELEGIKERGLIWVDKNLENLPIFYFGKDEKKIFLDIIEKKKFIQIKEMIANGERFFILNPSVNYGLLKGFDQDVYMAVIKIFNHWAKKLGYCPKTLNILFGELCSIMKITKKGKNFRAIEFSLVRFSNTSFSTSKTIYIRNKNRIDEYYSHESAHFFRVGIERKEATYTDKNTGEKKKYTQKIVAKVTLDDWLKNNIENGYTTDIDTEYYFNVIKSGRTRCLYKTLNYIRYQSPVFMSYKKLIEKLTIESKEMFHIKEAIKRAAESLIESDFLTKIEFNESNAAFYFKQVKKKTEKPQSDKETINKQKALVMDMLEALGDIKSEKFYLKVSRLVPDELIYKCLSLVREVLETSQIKTSRGAIFVDILKKECRQRNIKLFAREKPTGNYAVGKALE